MISYVVLDSDHSNTFCMASLSSDIVSTPAKYTDDMKEEDWIDKFL